LVGATHASADSLTLEWDAGTGSVGYKVHVGVQSGSYTQHFDVGSATLFNFPTATAGQRYCFAVSAYLLSSLLEGPNSDEVCGYSNTPPTLSNPGARSSTVGQPVTLQLQGSDPDGQPLTYSATGLPNGLSVQQSTGFISGTGSAAGTYSVTARAYDGALTASQTFTWTMAAATAPVDTTPPTISIGTPTSESTFSTTSATITLGGTAGDAVGVSQVKWASATGSGNATGTTSWNTGVIPLVAGSNVITVTAFDAKGNQASDSLTVNYTTTVPGDTRPPTISIGAPTTLSTYSTRSSSITLTGTAADAGGIAQVMWTRGTNSGKATGTTSWNTGAIPLEVGSNAITVTAFDAKGNQASDSLMVTYTGGTTTPPTTTTVTLKADPRKSRYWRATRLTWSNAPWSSVDIYRNGMRIENARNDGSYTDPVWGRGTYNYRICAAGSTTVCSNTATVYF
jgi:hypothetical protein